MSLSVYSGAPSEKETEPLAKQTTKLSAKQQAEPLTKVERRVNVEVAEPPAENWQTFEATAYIAMCDTGCTGITYTEYDVRNTIEYEGRRVVAVDKRVIPMYTKLTIRMASGEEIRAIAMDTGGAIKGSRVDIMFSTLKEANNFGRQSVSIKIDE